MSTAEIIAELPRLSAEELALVQAKLNELRSSVRDSGQRAPLASHPAVGIWKDRTDLPVNPVDASRVLREKLMRRTDE
jgi:hypothetical protein